MSFRLVTFQVVIFGLFLLLLANLVKIQLLAGSYYRDLSNGNRTQEITILAPRGIIYDRNGTALVANVAASRSGKIEPTRFYGYKEATAHVVSGVEQSHNAVLMGKNGKQLVEMDAVGNPIRTISTVEPTPGNNLNLNLDIGLQKVAYEQIKDKTGAIVVTNPNSGAVLAMVSSPSFDPEKLELYLSDKREPLFDRAISGTYPPGSTFKIITATAGLENGKITPETIIEDPGILIIGPYKFPNWKWLKDGGTQGTIDVVAAIQKSNDIFFYRTGEWVGIEELVSWAKKFGLAKPTGIDLPGEVGGLVKLDRDWYLGDTYHTAIGQGDLLVTPLQVNSWTNVIANGGKLCVPQIVNKSNKVNKINEVNENCKDLKISQKTLELVKAGLIAACKPGGTAWPLFGMDVACKTGTAEFGDPKNRTHAWLTAFAPINKPTIAVTVLVEGGGEGSDVAAPIVKKILEKYFSP